MPAFAGMAEALFEACGSIKENTAYFKNLRRRLIEGLSCIPHSVLNGDPVRRLPGNVNFCFEGIEGESLVLLLDARGIAASCTSGSLDPSHMLLATGRPHEIAHGSLRFALSPENMPEEVEEIIRSVE